MKAKTNMPIGAVDRISIGSQRAATEQLADCLGGASCLGDEEPDPFGWTHEVKTGEYEEGQGIDDIEGS